MLLAMLSSTWTSCRARATAALLGPSASAVRAACGRISSPPATTNPDRANPTRRRRSSRDIHLPPKVYITMLPAQVGPADLVADFLIVDNSIQCAGREDRTLSVGCQDLLIRFKGRGHVLA